jgi:hypothetical protein
VVFVIWENNAQDRDIPTVLSAKIEALFHDFMSWRGKLRRWMVIGRRSQSGPVSRKHHNFCQNPSTHIFVPVQHHPSKETSPDYNHFHLPLNILSSQQ